MSLILQRPHVFAVLSALLLATLSWNVMLGTVRKIRVTVNRPRTRTRFKIHIGDLQPDRLVSAFQPLLRVPILQVVQNTVESRIKPYILLSGYAQNPRLLGIRSVLYPAIAIMCTVPIAAVMALLYDPAFLGIIMAPLLLFGYSFVMLRIRASERSARIEDEFAPFAAMTSIMESVHVSLYSTFVSLAGSKAGIFPAMRREGIRIKNLAALGKSPTDSLMSLADSHPNMQFRDFIEGYISSYNTGGSDISEYLQEQAHRFFRFMQNKMSQYTKQADAIAQIILTIMLLLPMMGLSMMFFTTGQTASTMMLFLIVMFPFITIILVSMVHQKQPRSTLAAKVSWVVFPVMVVAAILVYFATGNMWEVIGITAVVGSAVNMVFLRRQFSEIEDTESPLPEFMRQVTRFKNIGMDIMHAVASMREEIIQRRASGKPARFTHTFDLLVDTLYRKMASGSSLEDAVTGTRIRSHNARIVFFILGKVHESGGGTAKTLDDITRWVTRYADAKKEMIASLRASLLTAFIGPILMVMMTVVSERLATEFEANRSQFSDAMLGVGSTADMSGMSEILTITASICMGVVLSKINYFTIRHTTFTGVITAVTMALLYAIPYFPEFGP